MEIAVIEVNNSQYIVSKNDSISIQGTHVPERVEVLLYKNDSQTLIGTPYVEGVAVEFEKDVEKDTLKVKSNTYKAKSRYRKHKGSTITYTSVTVKSIHHGAH
jgi:ribosomal protein L21